MRRQWTVGQLMLLVLACGVVLGILRSPVGPIFAMLAGGAVGCGLAPWYACRGMRKFERELVGLPRSGPYSRRRAAVVARSWLLIWTAWYLTGVAIATLGVLASYLLRSSG